MIRGAVHRSSRVWAALSLLAVVGLALVLRLRFSTGLVFADDLGYVQSALDLLHGQFRLTPWPGGQSRIGLYAPVALCYWLFGPGEASSLIFPLVCSLASIGVVYGLGRSFGDERTGLTGAFIWAVFPLDIQSATAVLPDGPVTLLTAASVWFFLRGANGDGRWPILNAVAAAGCLLWAGMVKPTALIAVAFMAVFVVVYRRERRAAMILGTMCTVAAVVWTYYAWWGGMDETANRLPVQPGAGALAATAMDWTHRLLAEPMFAAFAPLALAATAAVLARPRGRSGVAVMWAAVLFLVFELGSVSLTHYLPVSAQLRAGQVLFVLLPFAVIGGLAWQECASIPATRVGVALAALLVATFACVINNGPRVSWAVLGIEPHQLPFAIASGVALAGAIFGGVMALGLTGRLSTSVGGGVVAALCAAIGIASLHPAQMAVIEPVGAWHENLVSVTGFLRQQPNYPVLVQNRALAQRLNVASHLTLGYDYYEQNPSAGRIQLAPSDPAALPESAFIIVDDEHQAVSHMAGLDIGAAYLSAPPADWALVLTVGDLPGHRTRVYRFSLADALRDFVVAQEAATSRPAVDTLASLIRAATGARAYCIAARAHLRLLTLSRSAAEQFDPVAPLTGCLKQTPGVLGRSLLSNGDFAAELQGWIVPSDTRADVRVIRDADGPAAHISFRGGNWVVLDQGTTLEPDTAYVYRMRVRSTAPVVALYWQTDIGRYYEDGKVYADWTDLTFAFVTPHWNGAPRPASISPVLVKSAGEVWLRDIQLSRFTLDAAEPVR